MKKTFILKYLLLMISLTFLYTTPAFASAGAIVGSVDVFNGTQISGWAYETNRIPKEMTWFHRWEKKEPRLLPRPLI